MSLTSCFYETACTADFRVYSVNVETTSEELVKNATVETIVPASGDVLSFNQSITQQGTYIVIDDSVSNFGKDFKAGLKQGNNELLFRVTKDGKTVEQSYTSEISSCHVANLEGPQPFIFK